MYFSLPSNSEILPGAICEHLTSFGGNVDEFCDHSSLTDWIRDGAAGTSGTVTEPYALQPKFPMPFIHVHYAKGCSLAEAFYQSLMAPYQLLIIGEPLCKPWAKIPKVKVSGLADGDVVKGTLTLKPEVEDPKATPVGQWELFVDGKRQSTCQDGTPVGLETAQLPDGYHDLRMVALTADAVQTQGEWRCAVVLNNNGHTGQSKALSANVEYGKPARVTAKVKGAKTIVLAHNGRAIGTIQGEEGAFEVDSRVLGTGTVTVQAIGMLDAEPSAKTMVYCPPVELTIDDPPQMPASKIEVDTLKPRGVLSGMGTPVVLGEKVLTRGEWLKDAAVRAGQSGLKLAGFVTAPKDEMYQFQVLSDGRFEPAAGRQDAYALGHGQGLAVLPGQSPGRAASPDAAVHGRGKSRAEHPLRFRRQRNADASGVQLEAQPRSGPELSDKRRTE